MCGGSGAGEARVPQEQRNGLSLLLQMASCMHGARTTAAPLSAARTNVHAGHNEHEAQHSGGGDAIGEDLRHAKAGVRANKNAHSRERATAAKLARVTAGEAALALDW